MCTSSGSVEERANETKRCVCMMMHVFLFPFGSHQVSFVIRRVYFVVCLFCFRLLIPKNGANGAYESLKSLFLCCVCSFPICMIHASTPPIYTHKKCTFPSIHPHVPSISFSPPSFQTNRAPTLSWPFPFGPGDGSRGGGCC